MSTIGDYIHYNTSNYLKYGTARRGEPVQDFTDSYNKQKQAFLKRMNQIADTSSVLEELETRIQNEEQQKMAMQMAKDNLIYGKELLSLSDHIKQFIIDNATKDIIKVTQIKQLTSDNSNIELEEAKQARKRLYDNINRFNQDMQNGTIRNADSRMNTLINNFNDFFSKLGISAKNTEVSSLFKIKTKTGTLEALNAFVKSISLAEANKATLHGMYGEILVNSITNNAQSLAYKELQAKMKEALKTGLETSSFQIDETIISKDVQQQFYKDTGINLYQVNSSQNKVDASITIKDQDIEASVKAYTPKGNILMPHLQDINLLTSLATTEEQFANHWLNLHAANEELRNQKAADEELLKHMAYEALAAGNMLKKDSSVANTFVAIDVVQGRVYSQTVKNILLEDFSSFIFNPKINEIRIQNDYVQSWQQRISKILQQIHQIKIGVLYKIKLT